MIIISSILYSSTSFILLILITNLLGIWEFYRLFRLKIIEKIAGSVLSFLLFTTSSFIINRQFSWKIILIILPTVFCILVMELYIRTENPFKNLAFTFFAILYITIPCLFLICLAFFFPDKAVYHPFILLGLFFIVWASDTGAYILGNLFGKHALFKRISPNKTWEGSIGGAIVAMLTATIVSIYFTQLSYTRWLVIALIIIIVGTYGDFIKSLLKRSLRIKDTGTILPGHGGILDRFDSLLSSVPFVYCYLIIFK